MNKLATASKTWAKVAALPADRVMPAEVRIRRELSAEESAALDSLTLEAQARLLCVACSPWEPTASMRYVRRQLARIREEQTGRRPAAD